MPRKTRGKGTLRNEARARMDREINLEKLRQDIYRIQDERRRAEEESFEDFLLDATSYDVEVSTEFDRASEEYSPAVEDYVRDWWRADEPYDRHQ